MIKVAFGYDSESILDIDMYFDNTYQDEWLEDENVKQIIKDIDRSDVLSPSCIQSPVLGQIPVTSISGGAKTLICLLKDDEAYIDLVNCGENCEDWIVKIGQMKDIKFSLSGCDLVFKNKPIMGVCLNNNTVMNNWKEWTKTMVMYSDSVYREE